jgi:para-nitrobenzyl esterase
MTFRRNAQIMADRKAAQAAAGGAPVWTYLWTMPSPAYGGRYGAAHAVDVAPSMHDVRFPLSGPTAENLRLADQLAAAWVSLAASGNPNNPRTPDWPAYDSQRRITLVFGEPSNAVSDPRRPFREYWDQRASSARESD